MANEKLWLLLNNWKSGIGIVGTCIVHTYAEFVQAMNKWRRVHIIQGKLYSSYIFVFTSPLKNPKNFEKIMLIADKALTAPLIENIFVKSNLDLMSDFMEKLFRNSEFTIDGVLVSLSFPVLSSAWKKPRFYRVFKRWK